MYVYVSSNKPRCLKQSGQDGHFSFKILYLVYIYDISSFLLISHRSFEENAYTGTRYISELLIFIFNFNCTI